MSRRLCAGVVAGLLVAGFSLVGAPSAAATVQQGIGHLTTPAQPYKGNPDASDWLGSYIVGGKQVFCVQFAHLAPDSDEVYQPGMALKTKWGTDLAPDVAADISYLLLRYGTTKSADEAAALSHLLHTWTASPVRDGQLDPNLGFREIAYDAPFHLTKLPPAAQAAVQALTADAAANRGPWTASVTAPAAPQTIGVTAEWGVTVENAAHRPVPDVPVTIEALDATFLDETGQQVKTATLSTKDDGLRLKVTPTGTSPRIDIELASPAEVPVVQQAVDLDTQRVVSTGGEEKLTATGQASASPPPTTTTTTPQVPSKIPAGGTPDTPTAQAAMETRLSGGAIAGILGVLVLGGLVMWQLVLRKRERI